MDKLGIPRKISQKGKIEPGTVLWVRSPAFLLANWDIPTTAHNLGWLTIIVKRSVHLNKKKELTVEADFIDYKTPAGIVVQLTLTKNAAWEFMYFQEDDKDSKKRLIDINHPHNALDYVVWRPYPDLTEQKISEITGQFLSPSTSETGSFISFTTELKADLPEYLLVDPHLQSTEVTNKKVKNYIRRELNMTRMYQGVLSLSKDTNKPGLLLARFHEVFMRLARMKTSWEQVLDSLDNPGIDLTEDLLIIEDWIMSSQGDIFDPIPVWNNLFLEIKKAYNENFHMHINGSKLGIFLLYTGEVILPEEQDSPCVLHTSDKELEQAKRKRTQDWADLTVTGEPSKIKRPGLSDIQEGNEDRENDEDEGSSDEEDENRVSIPFFLKQDKIVQGEVWSKNEQVTAINKQPDGYIVKNWKGTPCFISNSLLKSQLGDENEISDAKLAKREINNSLKTIQNLEKKMKVGDNKFKTIENRVKDFKNAEDEQNKNLMKEIVIDIKNLAKRFAQHTIKLGKYELEAQESDMIASEESQRTVSELRKKQESLTKEYESVEKQIVRSGVETVEFPLFDELARKLIDMEINLDKLEEKATPKLSNRRGDVKTFSLSILVSVSIRLYRPGASFAEWINQILTLRKSNRVSEEVAISRALLSMEKYETALGAQLLSRNFTTFSEFESFIYNNHGTPEQLVGPLIQHHKQSGRIPYPLLPENSSRTGDIIHSHLSGMRSSQSLLSYLTEKMGQDEAQKIMQTSGPLNPMIIKSIKANLPPPDLIVANREMPSLTGLQQFSYLRDKLQLLLEDVRLMGTVHPSENTSYTTQDIVIGAAHSTSPNPQVAMPGNPQTAMPGYRQTNYASPNPNQTHPSPSRHPSRQALQLQNRSPGMPQMKGEDIFDRNNYNKALCLQLKNCLQNRLEVVDLPKTPGRIEFKRELLTQVSELCNGDQVRAKMLCTLMGTTDGCRICIQILDQNRDDQSKWLLPHLREKDYGQTDGDLYNFLPKRTAVRKCPMTYCVPTEQLREIYRRAFLCLFCGFKKENQNTVCPNTSCKKSPFKYCSTCDASTALCACASARWRQEKETYDHGLTKFSDFPSHQQSNLLPEIFVGSAISTNQNRFASMVDSYGYLSEGEHNRNKSNMGSKIYFGTGNLIHNEQNLMNTNNDNDIKSLENYQHNCNEATTGEFVKEQHQDLFRALYVDNRGVNNGFKTYMNRDNMLLEYPMARERVEGRLLFKLFYISFGENESLLFASDSCCSELCLRKDCLGSTIPCTAATIKTVQVAGGKVLPYQSVRLLLPVAANTEKHSHYEQESILMNTVIDNLPFIDLTQIVTNILYPNYLKFCQDLGQEPLFRIADLPLQFGGSVAGLMGERIFSPISLYKCSITGLEVFQTPFLHKGRQSLAVSGLIPSSLQSRLYDSIQCGTAFTHNNFENQQDNFYVLAGVNDDDDEEDSEENVVIGPEFEEVYSRHIESMRIQNQEPEKEITEKMNYLESTLLTIPVQASLMQDDDWASNPVEFSSQESQEQKRITAERKIIEKYYNNPAPDSTALEIRNEQQMILDSIEDNHKELQKTANQLSKEELELQFEYSASKSSPWEKPQKYIPCLEEFPALEKITAPSSGTRKRQLITSIARKPKVKKYITKQVVNKNPYLSSSETPQSLDPPNRSSVICSSKSSSSKSSEAMNAPSPSGSTGALFSSTSDESDKPVGTDKSAHQGDDLICKCPEACLFHLPAKVPTNNPINMSMAKDINDVSLLENLKQRNYVKIHSTSKEKQSELQEPMLDYLDSSADHQNIFQSDSEDESNNQDVIEPRNKVRKDDLMSHKLNSIYLRPDIQTYDKVNVSCQAQIVSNYKVTPIAPPDYSPQPQCLNTEEIIPATNSHSPYPGNLVSNDSDPTVIAVAAQPEQHSDLTPPRAEPMADITKQNWTKFSNNVHSLLATVNTDIRKEMNTKFCENIELLTNESHMSNELENKSWLSEQIRCTLRTPFSNQYGWLECEFEKLTSVQKQAVEIAHSLVNMLKSDPSMLIEGNFIRYRAYCDMISLWRLSIQKHGEIRSDISLTHSEPIYDDDLKYVTKLEGRDDLWFTTRDLICKMEDDCSILQMVNSKHIREDFAVEIIQIKIFLREDNPINFGILLPLLTMKDELEQFISSELSQVKQFEGRLTNFILNPMEGHYKLFSNIVQRKIEVIWKGQAANLVKTKNFGTARRGNPLPVLTPNNQDVIELQWTYRFYTHVRDEVTLEPWLTQMAERWHFSRVNNISLGKRLNEIRVKDDLVIAASLDYTQDIKPSHFISLDLVEFAQREILRLKQSMTSQDPSLSNFDAGPPHITLLAFYMPFGAEGQLQDVFEQFRRELNKYTKEIIVKLGKIKTLPPGHITVNIVSSKIEEINKLLISIFEENGIRVDKRFNPHCTLYKYNFKLQKGPPIESAQKTIINPAWEKIRCLHVYPMGKNNRNSVLSMTFSIEGWTILETPCKPSTKYFRKDNQDKDDESHKEILRPSLVNLGSESQSIENLGNQSRMSNNSSQPSDANQTIDSSKPGDSFTISGREMKQNLTKKSIVSIITQQLMKIPPEYIQNPVNSSLSVCNSESPALSYHRGNEIDNIIKGPKVYINGTIEAKGHYNLNESPKSPHLYTGSSTDKDPVLINTNENCFNNISKEIQGQKVSILQHPVHQIMQSNTNTGFQNKHKFIDKSMESDDGCNFYLDIEEALPVSCSMNSLMDDNQIAKHHPQFIPWDIQDGLTPSMLSVPSLLQTQDEPSRSTLTPHEPSTSILTPHHPRVKELSEEKLVVGVANVCTQSKQQESVFKGDDLQLLKAYLFPSLDPYSRCQDCLQCSCAPSVLFRAKEFDSSVKDQENTVIFQSIKPLILENNQVRFITKYPVDYALLNKYFPASNRSQILRELDSKLKKLTPIQKAKSQVEFSKLVNLSFLIPWNNLPQKIRMMVEESGLQNYICCSPAFKSSSLSSPARIAFNGSSRNKEGMSLNSLMPAGRFKMNMAQSFRYFRYFSVAIHGDLSKYFNCIYLSVNSMHLSRLLWRENCNLENPPEEYVMTRLFYGFRPSTSLCSAALEYIRAYIKSKCLGPCRSNQTCQELPCLLAMLIRHIYVDDVLFSVETEQQALLLKEYCIQVFSKFGFQFKDILLSFSDQDSPMLKDGICDLAGYSWNVAQDKLKVKCPVISNGRKHRGSIVKSSKIIYTNIHGERKQVQAPQLIVKSFSHNEDILIEDLDLIFKDVPKTIRFLISRSGHCFDPSGLIQPLGNQLRYVTNQIVKKYGLQYDQEISGKEYMHWLRMFREFLLGTKIWYSRKLQSKLSATRGKTYLIATSDYGAMVNTSLYLVHQLNDNSFQTTHLLGHGMLLDTTVPRGELQGVSIMSQMTNTVRKELSGFLDFVVCCTDSVICLFWSQKNPPELKSFERARVENIQRNIDTLTELYYCKSDFLPADIGSKFGETEYPFITAQDMAENGPYKSCSYWSNDIPAAINAGILMPAGQAILKHNGIIMSDIEYQNYITAFKWSNFNKMASYSHENIIDQDLKPVSGEIIPVGLTVKHGTTGKGFNLSPTLPPKYIPDEGLEGSSENAAFCVLASQLAPYPATPTLSAVKAFHSGGSDVAIKNLSGCKGDPDVASRLENPQYNSSSGAASRLMMNPSFYQLNFTAPDQEDDSQFCSSNDSRIFQAASPGVLASSQFEASHLLGLAAPRGCNGDNDSKNQDIFHRRSIDDSDIEEAHTATVNTSEIQNNARKVIKTKDNPTLRKSEIQDLFEQLQSVFKEAIVDESKLVAEHLGGPAVPGGFDIEERAGGSSSSLIQGTSPHSATLVGQLVGGDGVEGRMVAVPLDGLNTGLSALQTPEQQFAFLGEKNEAIRDDDINEPFSCISTLDQERSEIKDTIEKIDNEISTTKNDKDFTKIEMDDITPDFLQPVTNFDWNTDLEEESKNNIEQSHMDPEEAFVCNNEKKLTLDKDLSSSVPALCAGGDPKLCCNGVGLQLEPLQEGTQQRILKTERYVKNLKLMLNYHDIDNENTGNCIDNKAEDNKNEIEISDKKGHLSPGYESNQKGLFLNDENVHSYQKTINPEALDTKSLAASPAFKTEFPNFFDGLSSKASLSPSKLTQQELIPGHNNNAKKEVKNTQNVPVIQIAAIVGKSQGFSKPLLEGGEFGKDVIEKVVEAASHRELLKTHSKNEKVDIVPSGNLANLAQLDSDMPATTLDPLNMSQSFPRMPSSSQNMANPENNKINENDYEKLANPEIKLVQNEEENFPKNKTIMKIKIMKNKMKKRYHCPGKSTTFGIENIHYLTTFPFILKHPYDKILTIHKIIVIACIKFKGLLKTRKPLVLEKCYSNLLDSIVHEMPDFSNHMKDLQEYRISKLKHQMRIIKTSPYISATPQEESFSLIPTPKNKEDFLTLQTSEHRGVGGKFLDSYRMHPMAKRVVRFVSALFNICLQSPENKKNKNWLKHIWRLIQNLLDSVTHKFWHTSILSGPVLSDILRILKLVHSDGHWEQLLIISQEYKRSLGEEKSNFYISPQMFKFKLTTETMKVRSLKIDQIICESYQRARKAVTALFALKISSEVDEFATKHQKQNHCLKIGDINFCKSRFSSYVEHANTSNLVTKLLKQSGFSCHNLILESYSPVISSLFNLHHLSKGAALKTRKLLSAQHNGRDTTLMSITKTKNILSGNSSIAILIDNCWFCALRLKKYLKYPQGKIHAQGLPTNAQNPVFLSVNCDIAGPVRIKIAEGPETRSYKIVKAYILVVVCSVTKAVCLAFAESRKLVHIAASMRAVCSRVPTPLYWVCDNESSIKQLVTTGQGRMAVIQENSGKIEEFKILFCPPTSKGHISNSSAEVKIKTLRSIVGNFDFTRMGCTQIGAYNILFCIENLINSTPVALRNSGIRANYFKASPALQFLTPGHFLGIPNRRQPAGLIHLHSSVERALVDYTDTMNALNLFMNDFLVNIQKNAKTFDFNIGTVGRGDIVAFLVKSNVFHLALSDWRFGIAVHVQLSKLDNRARVITIRYTSTPGDTIDKILLNNVKTIITRRRLDQVIKLSDFGSLYFEENFAKVSKDLQTTMNQDFINNTLAQGDCFNIPDESNDEDCSEHSVDDEEQDNKLANDHFTLEEAQTNIIHQNLEDLFSLEGHNQDNADSLTKKETNRAEQANDHFSLEEDQNQNDVILLPNTNGLGRASSDLEHASPTRDTPILTSPTGEVLYQDPTLSHVSTVEQELSEKRKRVKKVKKQLKERWITATTCVQNCCESTMKPLVFGAITWAIAGISEAFNIVTQILIISAIFSITSQGKQEIESNGITTPDVECTAPVFNSQTTTIENQNYTFEIFRNLITWDEQLPKRKNLWINGLEWNDKNPQGLVILDSVNNIAWTHSVNYCTNDTNFTPMLISPKLWKNHFSFAPNGPFNQSGVLNFSCPYQAMPINWTNKQPVQIDQRDYQTSQKTKRTLHKKCSLIRVENNTDDENNNGHYRLLENRPAWHTNKLVYYNLMIGSGARRYFLLDTYFSWRLSSRLLFMSFLDNMELRNDNSKYTKDSFISHHRKILPKPSFSRVYCLDYSLRELDYFNITKNINRWAMAKASTDAKSQNSSNSNKTAPLIKAKSFTIKMDQTGSESSTNITQMQNNLIVILTPRTGSMRSPPLTIFPLPVSSALKKDFPEDRVIYSGNTVQMNCKGPQTALAPISWAKEGGQLPTTANIRNTSLTIKEVTPADSGVYLCQINLNQETLVINKFKVNIKLSSIQQISQPVYSPLFSAYNCSNLDNTEVIYLDRTARIQCRKEAFSAYKSSGSKNIAVVVQTDHYEEHAITCSLSYRVRTASCGQGFGGYKIYSHANGFRDQNVKYHPISAEECLRSYTSGNLQFKLSNKPSEHFEIRFKTGNNIMVNIDYFLGNSGFMEDQTCLGADTESVLGTPSLGKIYQLLATLHIVKRKIIVELSKPPQILVPSLGLQFVPNSTSSIKNWVHFTLKHTIVTEKINVITPTSKFTLLSDGHMDYYEGSTQMFVLQAFTKGSNFSIAFSKGVTRKVGSEDCFNTQFSNILLCDSNSIASLNLHSSPTETMDNLLTSGLALLSLKVDSAVSDLLYQLCKVKQQLQQSIMENPEKLGLLAFPERGTKGTTILTQGEIAQVYKCGLIFVRARKDPPQFCCDNMPVESNGNQLLYLHPLTRVLTTNCGYQTCSSISKTVFFDLLGKSQCYDINGLTLCRETFLQLNRSHLENSMFKPLNTQEMKINTHSSEDIRFLVGKLLGTQTNAEVLLSTIDQNSLYCGGSSTCLKAALVPNVAKIELKRIIGNLTTNWPFTADQTLIEQFLIVLLLGWIGWISLKSLFDFTLKELTALKNYGVTYKTIKETWKNLNSSFNPFHRDDYDLKDIQEQCESLEKRISSLSTLTRGRMRSNIHRINIILGLNDDPPPLPTILTMPAHLLLPEDTNDKMRRTRRSREALETHMSRTNSIQGVDRSNAKTFVRQESEMLISPLRKWAPAATNSPVTPPRAGTRNLPPAPLQGQPVYDSPRPSRTRFVTRPRSASLQCVPGQYLDMRAARSHYLYEPVGGHQNKAPVGVSSTIV